MSTPYQFSERRKVQFPGLEMVKQFFGSIAKAAQNLIVSAFGEPRRLPQ